MLSSQLLDTVENHILHRLVQITRDNKVGWLNAVSSLQYADPQHAFWRTEHLERNPDTSVYADAYKNFCDENCPEKNEGGDILSFDNFFDTFLATFGTRRDVQSRQYYTWDEERRRSVVEEVIQTVFRRILLREKVVRYRPLDVHDVIDLPAEEDGVEPAAADPAGEGGESTATEPEAAPAPTDDEGVVTEPEPEAS